MTDTSFFELSCPAPIKDQSQIKLAHGAGGRLMQKLIENVFFEAFDNPILRGAHDGAVLSVPQGRCVMTTDSYVVRPLFFPGGDIGALAVNGTVNDLAMCGAKPRYLTASFILEEGLDTEVLWRVVKSMRAAADAAGVAIVTGDTKVVERGHGDGLYINTTGIGFVDTTQAIHPDRVRTGDSLLVSGDIGRHGMAVMGEREGLAFESPIKSDCAPLWEAVDAMLSAGIDVHCLRDATRGGVCAVLNELAAASHQQFDILESQVPISDGVRGACEVLGLDPMYVACEGRFVAVVAQRDEALAMEILKRHDSSASVIGHVVEGEAGLVTLQTLIGGRRVLDMPVGELLPRIC